MAIKTWITRILLAFAIFTLGFGLGKDVGLRRTGPPARGASDPDRIVVHYLHATFRCVTCNTIEKMAKGFVENEFRELLATGRIAWQEENFQEREDLARKYDVASSTVVVVRIRDGKEVAFQRLDEVWTLVDKPDAFAKYVGDAIRAYLKADEVVPPSAPARPPEGRP